MQLIEVIDRRTIRDFHRVPHKIYAGDPNWIPHLEKDVEAVFDPSANTRFQAGEAIRWILKDPQDNLTGRVAAFIDYSRSDGEKRPTGGMGFFECVDDEKAAFLLFDNCKSWLAQRGMEAMDGPINFGEKERFWGLLVDGHKWRPPYLMNYHPSYYQRLFESYGFKNYYEQYVYQISKNVELPSILKKKYQRLTETQGYHFVFLEKKHIEKYAEDFMTVYNKAWGGAHKHFKPITKDQALRSFISMKDIIDEDLIMFGYHEAKPVAFFIGIPELNELFRHVKGKLTFFSKLKLLYYRWRGKCQTVYGLVFGIIPEYQHKGLESAMIMSIKQNLAVKDHYQSMYITWLGDFNPKMIRIVEHIRAKRIFTLITCRYLFDPKAVFERHPVLK